MCAYSYGNISQELTRTLSSSVTMASRRSSRPVTATRSTRSKPSVSYAEPSTDDSSFEDNSGSEANTRRRSSRKAATHESRTFQYMNPTPQTYDPYTSADDRRKPLSKKRKRPTTRSSRPHKAKRAAADASASQVVYNGIIPAWQNLPYQILSQIFEYASYPIYDENTFQPSPSGKWLIRMACLCRAFTEPALTALYTTPPLVPMVQAHQLVDLLKTDPTSLAFGYRQKIRALKIDVDQVVAYRLHGSGYLNLFDLIKFLPRLNDLELYHQKDMSPYRALDDHIKWTYPETMFDALEYIDPAADPSKGDKTSVCCLRSWRWSSRLAGKKFSIDKIQTIHLRPSFVALRKIAFVNYQIPSTPADEEDPKHEKILADSLRVLNNLQHLIFESSTLVNAKLLPLLPKSLRHLELINCWEVIADYFAGFLLTHGSQLRTLTLNHNQSLSLGFLPVLGEACPRLRVLKMNLSYYNLHASYHDSEPMYEQLLLPEQAPVWPSTLQTIELIKCRKWETPAAEMFFQSLLDSAPYLPDLRNINIQAILNIGWRDRASFRDKWIGSLERIFKRVSPPPRSHSSILPKAQPEAKDEIPVSGKEIVSAMKQVELAPKTKKSSEESKSSARRSQRFCASKSQQGMYAESSDGDEEEEMAAIDIKQPSHKLRSRSRMTRELEILKQTAGVDSPLTPATSSNTGSSFNSSDDDQLLVKSKGKEKEFIHGMCEVVELRIDNLRPTENPFNENDFMDSEVSGDEDWNGDDGGDDCMYAW
ncbi:hypothetical protein BGZ60DRAFT_416834 [Tricladium varicosporioides]|nr:hypothetical protein BGZ60DRAFT_416834 [Hymenoscyphus varicosporioides]